jgi:hypothetical protein
MSRLTITIPDVVHNRISILANEANESMSTIINKLIVFGLNYDGNPLANNSIVEEHCQQLIIQMNVLLKNLSAKMLQFEHSDFDKIYAASLKKIQDLKSV